MRRTILVGLGLAAVYTGVMAATMATSDQPVRPFFDGLIEPPPYRWVDPPFGRGANVEPEESEATVELGSEGSVAAGPTSSDSQVVLNLPANAIPRRPGNRSVTVTFTPLDAARLGHLPAGLTFDGNAYEVRMAYQPSGRAVAQLEQAGNIVLATPEPASLLLFASDGRRWETLDTQRVGGTDSVGSPFTRPGYYVAAIPGSPPAPDSGEWLETGRRVLIGVLVLALVAILALRAREARRSHASM